jgi:anhydro-N-acetylmuramic acid kinase
MLVMGYMSGTSLDGVDVAMIETDGESIERFGPALLVPFTDAERAVVVSATQDALDWDGYGPQPASFAEAAAVIDAAHERAGLDLIAQAGRKPDLVGFHGQTLLHRPRRQLSVQIGDPQVWPMRWMCRWSRRCVRTICAPGVRGAAGARLSCGFDAVSGAFRPGGFPQSGRCGQSDVDRRRWRVGCFRHRPGQWSDRSGGAAARRRALRRWRAAGGGGAGGPAVLADLLSHEHFRAQGAKSLDRYDFSLDWAWDYTLEDAVATLTAFTVESVALAVGSLPEAPATWVVCGGGCHNPVLMQGLRERLGDCRAADALGLRSDFVEAEAMGFLAARSLRGLPLTFPGTTGVAAPLTGGRLWRPACAAAMV